MAHLRVENPPVESDSGKEAPQLFAWVLSEVSSISMLPPTRNVSKKSKWQRESLVLPLMETLLTYADVPLGMVF